jgi:hypothetical protein
MTIAEGVAGSLRFKAYASGAMTANALAVSATDLDGSTGGQILRHTSTSLKLAKETYQANEKRTDRQISDFRHGVKRVTGSITGDFSPGTYFDLIEAALRGTKSAALSLSNTDFTSVVSNSGTSSFTFTAGDPVALGMRVGDILRFAGLAATGNNATNFLVQAFGGGSNRTVTVYPAPTTDAVADATFTVTSNGSTGKAIYIPSSSFVSRKFGFEIYNSDLDLSRLFTECRVGGVTFQLPATGMGTIEIPVMGRDMEKATGGSAPFFVSPTAETTTGIFAAVNGLLQVAGTTVGVVTGLNVQLSLNPSSDAVVGQSFVPEIFLGRANVSGQFTAFLQDGTFIDDFKNETEISILAYLTTTTAVNSPAVSIFLPRLKLGDADVENAGEGGQHITCPFQALKGAGTTAGEIATTFRLVDTEAS